MSRMEKSARWLACLMIVVQFWFIWKSVSCYRESKRLRDRVMAMHNLAVNEPIKTETNDKLTPVDDAFTSRFRESTDRMFSKTIPCQPHGAWYRAHGNGVDMVLICNEDGFLMEIAERPRGGWEEKP